MQLAVQLPLWQKACTEFFMQWLSWRIASGGVPHTKPINSGAAQGGWCEFYLRYLMQLPCTLDLVLIDQLQGFCSSRQLANVHLYQLVVTSRNMYTTVCHRQLPILSIWYSHTWINWAFMQLEKLDGHNQLGLVTS